MEAPFPFWEHWRCQVRTVSEEESIPSTVTWGFPTRWTLKAEGLQDGREHEGCASGKAELGEGASI